MSIDGYAVPSPPPPSPGVRGFEPPPPPPLECGVVGVLGRDFDGDIDAAADAFGDDNALVCDGGVDGVALRRLAERWRMMRVAVATMSAAMSLGAEEGEGSEGMIHE